MQMTIISSGNVAATILLLTHLPCYLTIIPIVEVKRQIVEESAIFIGGKLYLDSYNRDGVCSIRIRNEWHS